MELSNNVTTKENKAPYTWNKRGSKMLFKTAYKTFDKQTNFISSGNVIASTQYSNLIRCNETENIYQYDVQSFNLNRLASCLVKSLYGNCKNENKRGFYLYEFSIWNYKQNKRNVIGWLMMDYDNLTCYHSIVNGNKNYKKKEDVLNKCLEIIRHKNMKRGV